MNTHLRSLLERSALYTDLRLEWRDAPQAVRACQGIAAESEVLHVIVCPHIGDMVYTLGAVPALKRKYPTGRIAVYTAERMRGLMELYPDGLFEARYVEERCLRHLVLMGMTRRGRRAYRKLDNLLIVNPAGAFTEGTFDYIVGYPHLHFADCIRHGDLGLVSSGEFLSPRVPDVGAERLERDLRDTAILAPHAQYMREPGEEFWDRIIRALRSQGYEVLTSLGSEAEEPLPGTEGFRCSLPELMRASEEAACIVGTRSGLLDLLSFAKSRIVAVYPAERSGQMRFFSLADVPGRRARVREFAEDDPALFGGTVATWFAGEMESGG